MNKILLPLVVLLSSFGVNAQNSGRTHYTGAENLKEIVSQYQRAADEEQEGLRGIFPGEGDNYHFDRWCWYWEQHLDENGNMVAPVANYLELIKSETRARNKTTADQSDWKFRGPYTSYSGYGGIGRVNCIEFHPTNKDEYWVGAASGGAWRTSNDGISWVSMTHNLPRLDVSDIDINPLNPKTIYLCTGDRDGSGSFNNTSSIGVLKSYDGGLTWDTTGINWTVSQSRLTNCLVINPADTNSLTLATSMGIYKSFNGGATWTNVQSGHFKQVLYKPGDTSILYATRYGSDNGDVYRSTDGGTTWTRTHNPSGAYRITLAVTPANPNIVKGIVSRNDHGLHGIINSNNSGASFTQIYTRTGSNCNNMNGDLITGNLQGKGCGRQGWYDLAFAISPTNANEVYAGGVNTYGSTDGGASWTLVTQWYINSSSIMTVHADKHWLAFHPITKVLFECNDGGVYQTANPFGTSWRDISNGLTITEFYRNAVTNAGTYALAGSQDNGTKGLQGGTWYDITGGDGMECQADPIDSNVFYTGIQYGVINRTTDGGNNFDNISDNIPGQPSGSWITPYLINPLNNQQLIAAYEEIYYSPDRGDTWTSISGGSVTGEKATRLAITPFTPQTIYAIFPDTPAVFYAKNYTAGNPATFDTIIVPFNGNISDIKAHPTDSGRFYLTFSGYNNAQVVEYNKGVWKQMNSGLPNVPVRCFEFDSSNSIVYVGTDIGVYYMDSTTNNQWASFRNNMPAIEVTDLGINYTTKELWAATYGRGMWATIKQKYIPKPDTTDTTNSVAVIPYAEDVFTIAPNPNNGQFRLIAGKNVNAGAAVDIALIDYTGKMILKKSTELDNTKSAAINATGVPAGLYIIELSDARGILGRKRVIVR